MSYVLAIDQGTHSTRAAILNNEGEIIARESKPVAPRRIVSGRVEQDAEQLAISVESVIDLLLDKVPKNVNSSITSCGFATQRSSVLCWDSSGTPVSPILNWQDKRGIEQVEALRHQASEIKQLSGLPLSPHYGASKIYWLLDHYGQAQLRFGPLGSYLLSRISDYEKHLIDHANAQRMQLLDITEMQWSERLCSMFQIPNTLLPETRPVSSIYGLINETKIPIRAINGDQNAAWYASAKPENDVALVNIGSGAFILTSCEPGQEHPDLLKTIAWSDSEHTEFVLEATINGAGNSLSWLSENQDFDEPWKVIDQALTQITDPPLFINSVGGLGSPWWRSDIHPRFVPSYGDMSKTGMLSGVCESIIFLIVCNLIEIEKVKDITTLHVSGGLSQSDQICMKLANLSGKLVKRMYEPESTLRGISWIASGKPEGWAEPDYDIFQPETDLALKDRWHDFINYLGSYLGDGQNGKQ